MTYLRTFLQDRSFEERVGRLPHPSPPHSSFVGTGRGSKIQSARRNSLPVLTKEEWGGLGWGKG